MIIIHFLMGISVGLILSLFIATGLNTLYYYHKAIIFSIKGIIRKSFLLYGTFFNVLTVGAYILICFLIHKVLQKFGLYQIQAFDAGLFISFLSVLISNSNARSLKNSETDFWICVGNNLNTEEDKLEGNLTEVTANIYQIIHELVAFRAYKSALSFIQRAKKMPHIASDWDTVGALNLLAKNSETLLKMEIANKFEKRYYFGRAAKTYQDALNTLSGKDGPINGTEMQYIELSFSLSRALFFNHEFDKAIETIKKSLVSINDPEFRENYQRKYALIERMNQIASEKGYPDFFGGKSLEEIQSNFIDLLQRIEKFIEKKGSKEKT